MKAATLRDMPSEELVSRVSDLKSELFNLRFQLATGQLTNTMQIRECKKDIARCKTILREREIEKEQARA